MRNNLGRIITEKNISQNQLAKSIKVGQSTISRAISGSMMKEDLIRRICIELDVSADYLLGLTNTNTKRKE